MSTETIKLSKLVANTGQVEGLPKNPRTIRDERFEKLKRSIQEDPEMLELRELLVYPIEGGKFVVIGGNMRLAAMRALGQKDAPCKVIPKDTPPEKLRAYAIKDNVPFGEHDWDALANEWDGDKLADWGLDLPEEGVEKGIATKEIKPYVTGHALVSFEPHIASEVMQALDHLKQLGAGVLQSAN